MRLRLSELVPGFRYGLRTLLLLMTVLCLFFAMKVRQAKQQRAAESAVRQAGGRIEYEHEANRTRNAPPNAAGLDPPGPEWLRSLIGDEYFFQPVRISLMSSKATNEHVAPLRALNGLKRLDLDFTQVDDLSFLQGLGQLKWLDLDSTPISDSSLSEVRILSNLNELILDNTKITDRGIAHLADLPLLSYLRVQNTQVTGAGFANFHNASLAHIDFENSRLDDNGLAQLKHLGSLRSLTLRGTQISDSGLKHLQQMQSLEDVDLSDTRVTLEGIRCLAGLVNLTRLELSAALVTGEQLADLRRAMPKCTISAR